MVLRGKKPMNKPYTEVGLAANEITEKENSARYRAQQQLEPRTPDGVKLVIL